MLCCQICEIYVVKTYLKFNLKFNLMPAPEWKDLITNVAQKLEPQFYLRNEYNWRYNDSW